MRLRRLLPRAAAGVCLAVLIGFAVSYGILLADGSAGPKQTDFVPYYAAGKLVATGHGAEIYDRGILGALERAQVRPLHVRDGVMPFLYPAYFAVVMAPFAMLPYDAAFFAWLAVNFVIAVLCLVLLARYAQLHGSGATLFVLAGLSFLPVLLTLAQGQSSLLLLALLTVSLILLDHGRDGLGGMLLGIAIVKPPYILPVLLVLLCAQRWRAVAAFAACAAFLVLVPTIALGSSVVTGFVSTMVDAAGWSHQIGGFEPRYNQSFSGFFHLLTLDPVASTGTLILDLMAVGCLVLLILKRADVQLSIGLAITVGLLAGPHVLLHDLVLLLLPVAAALRIGAGARLLAVILTGYVLVIAGLPLSSLTHVQFSVVAMSFLAAWFIVAGGGRTFFDQLPASSPVPAFASGATSPTKSLLPRPTRADR